MYTGDIFEGNSRGDNFNTLYNINITLSLNNSHASSAAFRNVYPLSVLTL